MGHSIAHHTEVSPKVMPLLRDQVHSVATIKHFIQKICDTTVFLNPGQIRVVAADKLLYALAKQIQFQWPDEYGENKFVLIFGGLHIKMAAMTSIGHPCLIVA